MTERRVALLDKISLVDNDYYLHATVYGSAGATDMDFYYTKFKKE